MTKKLLIYGYGNIGRKDDGLAHFFLERIKTLLCFEGLCQIDLMENYQLNIEDAEIISNYHDVLFVDASLEVGEAYRLERIKADDSKIEFSMHAVSPSFVLDLCHKTFGHSPNAYLLHLRGFEWGFGEGLSAEAEQNLDTAIMEIWPRIKHKLIDYRLQPI
jgi:hydrogenase maturation protease